MVYPTPNCDICCGLKFFQILFYKKQVFYNENKKISEKFLGFKIILRDLLYNSYKIKIKEQ